LLKSAVPISRAAKLISKKGDAAKPAFVAALTDGEDFELLFTVASKQAVPLLDVWKTQFPALKLSCIGKIVAGAGIRLRDQTGIRPLQAKGYTHFS
jgi:thiamine-monophosphate kinase